MTASFEPCRVSEIMCAYLKYEHSDLEHISFVRDMIYSKAVVIHMKLTNDIQYVCQT